MQAAHHYAIDERARTNVLEKLLLGTFANVIGQVVFAKRAFGVIRSSAVATLPAEDYIASASAVMTQLTATASTYRDAVRFTNGREILLQRLNKGQRVRVLELSLSGGIYRVSLESSDVFRY